VANFPTSPWKKSTKRSVRRRRVIKELCPNRYRLPLNRAKICIAVDDISQISSKTLQKFRIILERNHLLILGLSNMTRLNEKFTQNRSNKWVDIYLTGGPGWPILGVNLTPFIRPTPTYAWTYPATIIRLKKCNHFEIFVPKSVYLYKRRQIRSLRSSVYFRR